ncbi:low-specificity L-threonine aldolase [Balneatrix alpica]|uniref:low-specificity L-threonine aldolase n=1 Tax=Balneatrix alpica TaxID=75684 RepID=UPI00273A53D5|nr:low-specificity L-threonine aldolase [Balneatrix alpica]
MHNRTWPAPLDLRSDTVTQPTPVMREWMQQAPVGDDVYGEDPSVQALEQRVAELTGKEAALYVSSGTQSNLLALLSHCQRGDEYLVGQSYHTYKYEAGGAAVLGSIQPQPLNVQADGSLNLDEVAGAIKPDDFHFARTRLLSLENTQGGKVIGLEYLQQARALCDRYQLRLHLDGARLANAAVALQLPANTLCAPFDSVSLCLSKGLGAPVGSVLSGSMEFIQQARRWRKMLGGGMRQAGILAAAGDYALTHHWHRLEQDHQHAAYLAQALATLPGVSLDYVATNILYLDLAEKIDPLKLQQKLAEAGIKISAARHLRLVTHLDIPEQALDYIVDHFAKALAHSGINS